MQWILQNSSWLFDGLGLAVVGVAWGLLKWGYLRWRETRDAQANDPSAAVGYARVTRRPLQARLPAFVLRLFLKPDVVRERVHIGLREKAPISLSLNAQNPQADFYFQITNLNPLDLILDRLLIEVWFGQPTFSGALLRRHFVPAGEITQGIHFRQMLAGTQKRHIDAFNSTPGNTIYIYLTAYFESKVGRVMVEKTIELSKL